MKKWRQLLFIAVLAVCFGLVYKTDASAAAITGVKQTEGETSSVTVKCDMDIASNYYYLEVSTDQVNWRIKEVKDEPNDLYCGGLSAGKSYYVRVGGASGYDHDYESDEYTLKSITAEPSEPIEVVTAPDPSDMAIAQAGATRTGISVKFTNVSESGANYYRIVKDDVIWGEGSSTTVQTTKALTPGTSYWLHCYACRKSSAGFVAMNHYEYGQFKTLTNAINTKNFGVSNAWVSINSFDFEVSDTAERDGLHFQFQTASGKVKKNAYTTGDYIGLSNFVEGTFYKYRVRTYVQCGSGRAYSAWSGFKTIALPKKVSGKFSSNGKTLKVSWSNVSGASGYTVYVSTKEHSGYKKYKSLSAKKRSVSITKVGGKKLKKGTTYYVRIVPKATISKKSVSAGSYGYYSFRSW